MPMINRGDFAPYDDVYNVLVKMSKESKYRGRRPFVVEEEVFRERLQFTPGLFFSSGTTWDSIINDLVGSGLMPRFYQRGVSYVVLPLVKRIKKG